MLTLIKSAGMIMVIITPGIITMDIVVDIIIIAGGVMGIDTAGNRFLTDNSNNREALPFPQRSESID